MMAYRLGCESGRFAGGEAAVGLSADLTWVRPVALPPVATDAKRLRQIVDYEARHDTRAPIERCPTGAIVWIDAEAGAQKGAAAPRVVRREPLRDAPT